MTAWLNLLALGNTDALPLLPSLGAMSLWRSMGWALVLASLAWNGALGLGRLPARWRASLALLLAVAMLLPGSLGLAYWLGLAFQAPSLVSVGLAVLGLLPMQRPRLGAGHLRVWSLATVVLGWLLLLDTLALLPVFLYPWGYGPPALMTLLGLAMALPAFRVTRPAGWAALAVALVFVVTRLPSGNLWDALLDPWLWLLSHALLLRAMFRRA